MTLRKSNTFLSLVNSYLIDSPQPSSINYWWNLGSLLGLCLVIQIASGLFLAMHYSSNIELAFDSVEHIMRDVNAGWLIRYIHANGASFFFVCLYLHIGKALYYGSYKSPRVTVYTIGIIIFILTIATAFMGYCLVYGQMSHWGFLLASHALLLSVILYLYKYPISSPVTKRSHVNNLIGPLNTDIISIIYGSMLGDAHAERRAGGVGTRILFFQESSHQDYLLYLHSLVANLQYCSATVPVISTRLGSKGRLRQVIRFSTWTYTSFNFIREEWYQGETKVVPKSVALYLTPMALAIWIMDDGSRAGSGLKLSTNSFTREEVEYLIEILHDKYGIKCSLHKTGAVGQFNIYVWTESMSTLAGIVKPYIILSMKYKFGKYL